MPNELDAEARGLSRRSLIGAAGALAVAGVLTPPRPSSAAAASTPGPAPAGPSIPALEAFLQREATRNRAPGIAVAVFDRRGLVWSRAHGAADLEAGTPMAVGSSNIIASVTKTFVATAILQQWEQGRIGLNDDLSTYLPYRLRNPAFPKSKITFRHVLTHTTSLSELGPTPGPYDFAYFTGDLYGRLGEWSQIYLGVGQNGYGRDNHMYLRHRPGTYPSYSNIAWAPAAQAISNVTGTDFTEYVLANIVGPLGLTNTGFRLDQVDLARHVAQYTYYQAGRNLGGFGAYPYLFEARGTEPHRGFARYALYSQANFPDGGLRSCVHDLALYGAAWLNGGQGANGQRILAPGTVDAALRLQPIRGKRRGEFGFAWYPTERPHGWIHTGMDLGATSALMFSRKRGTGAAMVRNTDVYCDEERVLTRAITEVANASLLGDVS